MVQIRAISTNFVNIIHCCKYDFTLSILISRRIKSRDENGYPMFLIFNDIDLKII